MRERKTRLPRRPHGWIARSAMVALLALFVAGPTFAQGNKYTFGTRNQKKVSKAFDLINEGNVEGGLEILNNINLKRAKPYGRARIHSILGSYDAQEEKYESALDHLEKAVAENALQPEDQLKNLYLVGQLQTMLQRYDDAILTLESWMSQLTTAPAPASYYTLAVTYYQAERSDEAIVPAKKAIENSDEPREAWYRLLLSLHLERQEYEEALALLDDIILAYPSKAYWSQMAAIYSELDQMDRSLAVQQLAKNEGFIKEDRDLTRIAQMFMVEGLPHRGAAIMKQGLEDGTIEPTKAAFQTYSDTLLQSREWKLAVEPLRKAAELNDNGSLYMRLAQVHLQLGEWANARASLNDAFEKGGLPDEGQANILFGIAAANDKKWNSAKAAFGRAKGFEGTREVAGKWIAYVDREMARLGEN